MKLTKLQLKEIIKEVIAEEQKFYAREPGGSRVSIFTNKDNWKKAIKGGYSKVDPEQSADPFADEPTKPANKYKLKRTTLDVADELALDFEDNYGDMGFDDYMEYGFAEPPQHVQDMLDELPDEQANAVMGKVEDMLYKKYGRHEESITSQLKREFKQYNDINKNLTIG